MTDGASNDESQIIDDIVPWAGEVFVISEESGDHTITVCNGTLRVCRGLNQFGGFFWECVENNGWLGFRNCISGKYMGRDDAGNFVADAGDHTQHEWICARRHPDGGYVLLVRRGDDLLKMAIGDDGQGLVETRLEGTRWVFNKAYMAATTERFGTSFTQAAELDIDQHN